MLKSTLAARSGVIVTSRERDVPGLRGPVRSGGERRLLVEDDARDAEARRERVARGRSRVRARTATPWPLHGSDLEARARHVEPDGQDSRLERGRRVGGERGRRRHEHARPRRPLRGAASRRLRRSRRPASPTESKSKSHLRVVLRDPHAAVRGRVGRYVGVLVHRDAAVNGGAPTAASRGTASTTSARTSRRRGTSRSSSGSRACRSRRRSCGRPGCPGSRARADGRSAPRRDARRGPA